MLDWTRVETVLLDMDGTLLDLRFDSQFWLHHLPACFADHHGLDAATAQARLDVLFRLSRQKLEYYCLDWWSDRTGLDIVGLKQDLIHLIRYRPSAREFLAAVRDSGRRAVIVTNAHRAGLALKHRHTGIIDLVDAVESAHDHRLPKEDAAFWSTVHNRLGFDPSTTLLVDDNMDALAAAERYGIRHLLAVAQPDSGAARLEDLPYPAVEDFALLQPIAPLLATLQSVAE